MNSENLIVLVGTNPLPVYVSARYFLDTCDLKKRIYFMFSKGNKNRHQGSTYEYALNIVNALKSRGFGKNVELLWAGLSDIENKQALTNDILGNLQAITEDQSVHFSYTGGTKFMSVHIYDILKEKFGLKMNSSYLSAKTYRLINESGDFISADLRDVIRVGFAEMVNLHGFERTDKKVMTDFNSPLGGLRNLIEQGRIKEFFEDYNRKLFMLNGDLVKTINNLKISINDKKITRTLLEINSLFPENTALFDNQGNLLREKVSDNMVQTYIEFIDGRWLEYLVDSYVKELDGVNSECDWTIRKKEWPKNSMFQIDNLLIKGYQLAVISCTTSKNTKKSCKVKGFEVFMRSRQIGGEEAKSVLVTRLDANTAKLLQDELQLDTGSTSKNLIVLGINDWKKEEFTKKLKAFLEA